MGFEEGQERNFLVMRERGGREGWEDWCMTGKERSCGGVLMMVLLLFWILRFVVVVLGGCGYGSGLIDIILIIIITLFVYLPFPSPPSFRTNNNQKNLFMKEKIKFILSKWTPIRNGWSLLALIPIYGFMIWRANN